MFSSLFLSWSIMTLPIHCHDTHRHTSINVNICTHTPRWGYHRYNDSLCYNSASQTLQTSNIVATQCLVEAVHVCVSVYVCMLWVCRCVSVCACSCVCEEDNVLQRVVKNFLSFPTCAEIEVLPSAKIKHTCHGVVDSYYWMDDSCYRV